LPRCGDHQQELLSQLQIRDYDEIERRLLHDRQAGAATSRAAVPALPISHWLQAAAFMFLWPSISSPTTTATTMCR